MPYAIIIQTKEWLELFETVCEGLCKKGENYCIEAGSVRFGVCRQESCPYGAKDITSVTLFVHKDEEYYLRALNTCLSPEKEQG